MKNIFILILFILTLSACGIDKESPQPVATIAGGELDSDFNNSGFFSHNNAAGGSNNDEGFGVAVDSAGRMIIAGQSLNGSGDTDMTVWVLNENGVLDPTFSSDGVFTHNNAAGGNGNDAGFDVAVDANNNIYVTGYSLNGSGNFDMVVWKIDSTGNLVNDFATSGIFVHDNAAGGSVHDQGNGIFLISNATATNAFVTGYSDQTVSNRDMALWKIKTDGTLDNTFGTGGIVTVDGSAGGEDDIGENLFIRNGTIYVAGRSDSASNSADMALWTFNADTGVADAVFTHNNAAGGNAFDAATDVVVDEEGFVYATGYSRNASNNNDMVIWSLTPSGALNTSFSSDGIFVFDIAAVTGSSTSDTGESITMDSDGNLIIAGAGDDDATAWRITNEGVLDESFNGDGSFFHDAAAGGFATDAAQAVFYDTENDLLYMSGYSENGSGDFDMAAWRLE